MSVDDWVKRYKEQFPAVAQRDPGVKAIARSTLLDMGADFGYEVYMSEWEDGTTHAMVLPRPGSDKVQKLLLELVGETWYIDELRAEATSDKLGIQPGFTKTFPKHDRPKPDNTFLQVFLNPTRIVFNDGVRVARKEGNDIVVEVEGQRPHEHKHPHLKLAPEQ